MLMSCRATPRVWSFLCLAAACRFFRAADDMNSSLFAIDMEAHALLRMRPLAPGADCGDVSAGGGGEGGAEAEGPLPKPKPQERPLYDEAVSEISKSFFETEVMPAVVTALHDFNRAKVCFGETEEGVRYAVEFTAEGSRLDPGRYKQLYGELCLENGDLESYLDMVEVSCETMWDILPGVEGSAAAQVTEDGLMLFEKLDKPKLLVILTTPSLSISSRVVRRDSVSMDDFGLIRRYCCRDVITSNEVGDGPEEQCDGEAVGEGLAEHVAELRSQKYLEDLRSAVEYAEEKVNRFLNDTENTLSFADDLMRSSDREVVGTASAPATVALPLTFTATEPEPEGP